MRTCGHCGDRYDADLPHACYVLDRLSAQESLPSPIPSDYASERPTLSDAAWLEQHTLPATSC
jgi:hypothetical protein